MVSRGASDARAEAAQAAHPLGFVRARLRCDQRFPGFREVRSNYVELCRPGASASRPQPGKCGRPRALGKVAASGLPTSEPARVPFCVAITTPRTAWGELEALAAREVHPMANSDGLLQHHSERELISTVR